MKRMILSGTFTPNEGGGKTAIVKGELGKVRVLIESNQNFNLLKSIQEVSKEVDENGRNPLHDCSESFHSGSTPSIPRASS